MFILTVSFRLVLLIGFLNDTGSKEVNEPGGKVLGVSLSVYENTSSGQDFSLFNQTVNSVLQTILSRNDTAGALLEGRTVVVNQTVSSHTRTVVLQPGPVVWKENQLPGTITTLSAKDNDGPDNGPPFKYTIANSANSEIRSKFGVSGKLNCFWHRMSTCILHHCFIVLIIAGKSNQI